MNTVFAAVDGSESNFGTACLIALVSVLLVFAILAIIIGVTYVVSIFIDKAAKKKVAPATVEETNDATPLDINDEDATVAALVASIECRNETKMNVKVISVKEIK